MPGVMERTTVCANEVGVACCPGATTAAPPTEWNYDRQVGIQRENLCEFW